MTKQEWESIPPSKRKSVKNFLQGSSPILTPEEVLTKVRQQLKLKKINKHMEKYIEKFNVGIKPIPLDKFLSLKLFNQYIHSDNTYDRFLEVNKLFNINEKSNYKPL